MTFNIRVNLLLFFLITFSLVNSQQPPTFAPLDAKRNFILNLINRSRLQLNQGLSALFLDVTLNGLAQFHSEDMAKRNFVGHYNPDGRSPQQRATAAGFTYEIGENVGKGSSLSSTFVNIMGDAIQYGNTIDKKWTRAGVGITDRSSVIYITIVFSTRDFSQYPLTNSERWKTLNNIKAEVVAENANINTQVAEISSYLTSWLDESRYLPYIVPIFQYISKKGYEVHPMSYCQQIQTKWSDDLLGSLKRSGVLKANFQDYTKYGIGLRVQNTGLTTVSVIFTQ